MNRFFIFLFPVFLFGCVGGTLGDAKEFEMFPLRAASDKEGKQLKRCLKTAHNAQEFHKKKTGRYVSRVKELPLDSACEGLNVTQGRTGSGYEIRAELREDETTVRWSVNENGVIEEHLDPESGADLDL